MIDAQKIDRIGRYQILERVGKGGMGVLYRGFDPVLDREVAIKLMQADFTQDAEQMRPRFYREARAAAKLNHRNIVTIFEFAEESNVPYIVMEFLRGTSLGVRMGHQPPLTLDDKLSIVAQLCDGLAYAHEQGVVHRDVKPDNVFVLEDGTVKLLDFGIAKLTTSNITKQGDVLGSASYMSPEQVGGSEAVDGRADVFSTGVVLYELLTGHKPFEAEAPTAVIVKILRDDPTPPDTYVPSLPAALSAAVLKALAKDPADRFANADAFSRELQLIRRSLPAAQVTPNLDETRFADTMMLKSLRADIERLRETPRPSRDISASVKQAAEAARDAAAIQPAPFNMWYAAAFAAVLALASAGTFIAFSGRMNQPAPSESPMSLQVPVAGPKAESPTGAASPEGSASPAGSSPASSAGGSRTAAPGGASASSAGKPPGAAPAAGAPAGSATNASPTDKKPAPPRVAVSLSGAYDFEVQENGRVISAANRTHSLNLPAGTRIVISAPQYFLLFPLRIDGSPTKSFQWTAPGLGKLDIRSTQENCDVVISGRIAGNPPVVVDIAEGQYKVDLSCGGEVAKSSFASVRAGVSQTTALR